MEDLAAFSIFINNNSASSNFFEAKKKSPLSIAVTPSWKVSKDLFLSNFTTSFVSFFEHERTKIDMRKIAIVFWNIVPKYYQKKIDR